jgi:hypothetical protein
MWISGWMTCSAVGRGRVTPHYLIEEVVRMACVAGPVAGYRHTVIFKLKHIAMRVKTADKQARAMLIRVTLTLWQRSREKVYRPAERHQKKGFMKDFDKRGDQLHPPESSSLLLLNSSTNSTRYRKHETCWPLTIGVSASPSLHLSLAIGPNEGCQEYERKQRRSVGYQFQKTPRNPSKR